MPNDLFIKNLEKEKEFLIELLTQQAYGYLNAELMVAKAKLDEAPQNRINGKTKDVLTIGDVYADVTIQQLTDSSVYNSLTMVEKIAKMNEFNNESQIAMRDVIRNATHGGGLPRVFHLLPLPQEVHKHVGAEALVEHTRS